MERLWVELARESLDLLGRDLVAAELARLPDLEVLVATQAPSLLCREAEMHDVAILDDVVLPLEPELPGIAGARFAAQRYIIIVGNRLGTDEALFEIGVDDARGLRRARPFAHRPGTRFLRPSSEIGKEVQELVAGPDHAVE